MATGTLEERLMTVETRLDSLADPSRRHPCNLSILPYTEDAATQFEALRKQHRRLSSPDLKIAAITLVNDAILLTQNERDFCNITGLNMEDWTR